MLQYLDMYTPTIMEEKIVKFYRKNHIYSPQDIDPEMWANEASIWIHRAPIRTTHHQRNNGLYTIILDSRMPEQQQRLELAHELGHVLYHAGNQMTMGEAFRQKQEWEADRFAFYALAPTFMIANALINAYSRQQLVDQLADTFDVSIPFMDYRLDMLESRMKSLIAQRQTEQALESQRAMYDYTFRHPSNPRIEYWVKDNRVVHRRMRAEV